MQCHFVHSPRALRNRIPHKLCIVTANGIRFLHDYTQYQKLQKLESELQDLINKREKVETAWISMGNVSPEAQQEKLEEMRNKRPKNILLEPIHVAHKNVLSKKDEVEKINRQFKSMQLVQMKELDPELARLITCKEHEEEQVAQPA